jgi:H+-translocating NAD(P) transhydrogenase subunit alpha
MRIFVPKEVYPGETRVAIAPGGVSKLARLGAEVEVEKGIGAGINWTDDDYEKAGARLSTDRIQALKEAELILRVRKPPIEEAGYLRPTAIHVSLLDPFNEEKLVWRLAEAQVTAISMEMIPRVTVSQPMDVLSSQANLVGYEAVILAAAGINRILPMMTTAAGTIKPLRMFVIGVGVAGLQAIATGRRLGAWVEAFDTRPVVEDQVKSLGAKFVKLDLGETGETAGGYAKPLTPEQLQKQRELMAEHVALADIVITAAQVFGRKAPVIITSEMLRKMRPGSVVVDTAIDTGGNVEGAVRDQEVTLNGVKIIGFSNLAGRVSGHASEMYSNNLCAFVQHFWSKETKKFGLDLNNEILKACVVTHGGQIVNETIKTAYGAAQD